MRNDKAIFVPSLPIDADTRQARFIAFEPGTRTLPKGFQVGPQFAPLPDDIVFDKDVEVTLRDGTRIYVDVFRPVGAEKVPVIVAWSPYGKSNGSAPRITALFRMLGMQTSGLSGLMKFEGPDPAFWCRHGYAVCNPDARGVYEGGGDSVLWDKQEGEDSADVIDWLGVQPWCNGKVGMSGNSYLAIAQWFAAAEQPRHLAAIAPWEGLSDVYRDLVMRGGIPDVHFAKRLEVNYMGKGQREDVVEEAKRHPLINDLWERKIPQFENITVPAYVVASYSSTLHTIGTFRGWRRIRSADKWLRIHNNQEWPDFYEDVNQQDLRRFFDHYLKGANNGWEETPRVRYSVLDMKGNDRVLQPATAFPPEDVTNVRYYLNGASRTLSLTAPEQPTTASYEAESPQGQVSFVVRFDKATTLVGYPKASLWVEAKGADDMDVFVLAQKLDASGTTLQQFTVPNQGAMMQDLTEYGASVLRYKGSNGRLRVSARQLDEKLSTDAIPVQSFDRVSKLKPGEVVCVEIELSPIGLSFAPGEQLRLVISGHNRLGGIMPGVANVTPDNHGQHVIHAGKSYASYVLLPVKATP
jgi:predicted acyl esterase